VQKGNGSTLLRLLFGTSSSTSPDGAQHRAVSQRKSVAVSGPRGVDLVAQNFGLLAVEVEFGECSDVVDTIQHRRAAALPVLLRRDRRDRIASLFGDKGAGNAMLFFFLLCKERGRPIVTLIQHHKAAVGLASTAAPLHVRYCGVHWVEIDDAVGLRDVHAFFRHVGREQQVGAARGKRLQRLFPGSP